MYESMKGRGRETGETFVSEYLRLTGNPRKKQKQGEDWNI